MDYIGQALKLGRRPYKQPFTGAAWPEGSYRAMHAGEPLFPDSDGNPSFFGAFVGWQGDLKEKVRYYN